MKLHPLKAGIIGASATLFALPSFGYVYDSDASLLGKALRQHHAIFWNAGDCPNATCDSQRQGFNETTLAFSLSDPLWMPDHSHVAGGTTNYTNNGSPDVYKIDSYYPECTAADQAAVPPLCGPQNDSAASTILGFWNVDVGTTGKLLNGWATAEVTTPAATVVSGYLEMRNGQTSKVCVFGVSPAAVTEPVFQSIFDGTIECNSTTIFGGAAFLYETTDGSYATCNPADAACGGGKTVPVPAFAAAALGLGLVGITLATRRRKTIS